MKTVANLKLLNRLAFFFNGLCQAKMIERKTIKKG